MRYKEERNKEGLFGKATQNYMIATIPIFLYNSLCNDKQKMRLCVSSQLEILLMSMVTTI